jgi:arsenate reductase-like glutaredoxin family protein
MKTARLQVLTTPAFRDWLRREAKNSGISVAELVRTRCQGWASEEEKAVADMAAQLRKEVRRAQSSLRSSLARAEALVSELRAKRESRKMAELA